MSKLFKVAHDLMCRFYGRIFDGYSKSYAQFGEDLLLKSFLGKEFSDNSYKGFWVDIGAHDPVRYSNTKIFSERGWRGINVDALPEAIVKFKKMRRRDINVNVGIGPSRGELDYYMFSDHAVNTFSVDFAKKIQNDPLTPFKFIGIKKVKVITLKELLDQYLSEDKIIDFFTIDTEGLDLTILQSNDWLKYRPKYILIEIHRNGKNAEILTSDVACYLKERNYEFVAQGFCTTLFARKDLIPNG